MDTKRTIVVVGAGPSGMMAAIRAAELGCEVLLIEKNPTLGKKLLLSGKGRCNLTNTCDLDLFLSRFSGGGQFLRDAFKQFFYPELMHFFQERGLELKVERQMRVFPSTDRSASILHVLEKELRLHACRIMTSTTFKDIKVIDKRLAGVILKERAGIDCCAAILATGGLSYRFTGSTGDGIEVARRWGHHIVALRPGLVPLLVKERLVLQLEGLTLKNIQLHFSCAKQEITTEVGELLFTSRGISGPLVLSVSGKIAGFLSGGKTVSVRIDLKPALSCQQLHNRLLREFQASAKKSIKNILKEALPQRLIQVFMQQAGLDPDKKANQVTQKERESMVSLLKGFCLTVTATEPLEEAMVTQGGVALKEIDPRTMESRIIKNLYFCGEMIDVDADTGGFNLQAAFSTGYLAGQSAARACI